MFVQLAAQMADSPGDKAGMQRGWYSGPQNNAARSRALLVQLTAPCVKAVQPSNLAISIPPLRSSPVLQGKGVGFVRVYIK